MLETLERITQGEGRMGDVEQLVQLGTQIKDGALCGLGQTAPNPVLTTIKYFRNEYDAHINSKKCPAKQCQALIIFSINESCTGCTLCKHKCPTDAIGGELKAKHVIDDAKCIKCGKCAEVCRFNAVEIE